jgi:glycosyltransferase involved in cell wall biosynthesis
MMTRVLVVSSTFPPLGRVGASIRLVKFLEHLAPAEFRFDVLTQAPGGTVLPIACEAESLSDCVPGNIAVHRRGSVIRLPSWLRGVAKPAPASNDARVPRTRRLKQLLVPDEDIVWVGSVLPYALALARRVAPQVVVGVAPSYSMLLLADVLARTTGAALVVDMKDDWLENSVRQRKPDRVIRLEMHLEKRILRRATSVLVPTARGVRMLRERHPDLPDDRFVCLPNGFDHRELARVEPPAVQRSERFTIACGCGGLAPGYRDVTTFLIAVSQLLERRPEARGALKVLLLGSDVSSHYAALLQERRLVEIVRGVAGLSRMEYLSTLRRADALLLVQLDTTPSSISGTLYEYAAVEGPPIMLVGGRGATREFVEDRALGWAFDFAEIERMARTLEEVYDAWRAGTPRQRAVPPDLLQFDRGRVAQRFEQVLQRAADESVAR